MPSARTRPVSSTVSATQAGVGSHSRHLGDQFLAHPFGIEAGIDGTEHLRQARPPAPAGAAGPSGSTADGRPDPYGSRASVYGAADDRREAGDQSPSIDVASSVEWRILLSASSCKY